METRDIGKYILLAELGRGAFSCVYLAKTKEENEEDKRLYFACKEFYSQSREQCLKERDILQDLKDCNPHILCYEDYIEHDNKIYLITQLTQVETLKDQIDQMNGKPFGTERALAILTQVGEAIAVVHERRILHGDITPENILFDENNRAILADFGIAIRLQSDEEYKPSPLGKLPYMAPERFAPNNTMTEKSDQYSLGCIAYELFTGIHPLGAVHRFEPEMIQQKSNARRAPLNPCLYNNILPQHIGDAVLKAIKNEAAERHDTIKQFIEELNSKDKEHIVTGYEKRYGLQRATTILQKLTFPDSGPFRYLCDQLKDISYTIQVMRDVPDEATGERYPYCMIRDKQNQERIFLYIPTHFIITPTNNDLRNVHSIIRGFMDEKPSVPILVFYESFEQPDRKIMLFTAKHKAGVWFISAKYVYEFITMQNRDEGSYWAQDLWNMTQAKQTT